MKKSKRLRFKIRRDQKKARHERKRKAERKLLKELEYSRKVFKKATVSKQNPQGIDFDAVAVRKQNIADRVHNREVTAGWAAKERQVRKNDKIKTG